MRTRARRPRRRRRRSRRPRRQESRPPPPPPVDLEGGEFHGTLRITPETLDRTRSPLYTDQRLAVGECVEGWIAFRHGNPDLGFPGIAYAPADGDAASWRA
ncbi:hypothetical protein [Mariniluteicoccus flavus]